MRAIAALALGASLLGASEDPSSAARYFAGTWKCGAATLTFSSFADTSAWTRVAYGSVQPEGTAIFGYVSGMHAWVYRDFHKGGAYADLTSPGPSDGRWQWTGPYYPEEGGPPLQDRTTFVQVSSVRFDRTFELMRGADYVPTGNDACTKVTS